MDRSFGMTARPRSLNWDELKKGATIAEVRDHLRRIDMLCHTSAQKQAPVR